MEAMMNAMESESPQGLDEDNQENAEEQEDYYGNFARRVYFLADMEGWDQKKTMYYFNNREAFEKYYNNVSRLRLGNQLCLSGVTLVME